jgi:hypothetical protein
MLENNRIDWFKYSSHYNKDSKHGGLCSRNHENCTATSCTYRNHCNSSNNYPHNKPFFIKPYLEERKASANTHRDHVIDILRKWSETQILLSHNVGESQHISIPLYFDFLEKLNVEDPFGEAESHLRTGYPSVFGLFTELKSRITMHNNTVSAHIPQMEKRIIDLLTTNPDILLIENKDLPNDPFAKMYIAHKDMGFYLSNIFEHFRKQATTKDTILVIEDFMNEFGWNCPKMFRSDTPDKIIAMIPAVGRGHKRLQKIKAVLSNQEDIVNKIHELDSDNQDLQNKVKKLQYNITKIIHDSPLLGLKGHCNIEEKLLFRYRLRRVLARTRKLKVSKTE